MKILTAFCRNSHLRKCSAIYFLLAALLKLLKICGKLITKIKNAIQLKVHNKNFLNNSNTSKKAILFAENKKTLKCFAVNFISFSNRNYYLMFAYCLLLKETKDAITGVLQWGREKKPHFRLQFTFGTKLTKSETVSK